MIAPVVNLNMRRRLNCPHCDVVFQIGRLIAHIDGRECPVLEARRNPTKAGA